MFLNQKKVSVLVKKWNQCTNETEKESFFKRLLPKDSNEIVLQLGHFILAKDLFINQNGATVYSAIKSLLLKEFSAAEKNKVSINYQVSIGNSYTDEDQRYEYCMHHASTLLHAAARVQEFDLMKQLMEQGARVDLGDAEGDTVLHVMAFDCAKGPREPRYYDYAGIISKILQQNSVLINSQNKLGDTPLHLTIRNGDVDYMLALLQQNADLSIRNGRAAIPELGVSPYLGVRPCAEIEPKSYLSENVLLDTEKLTRLANNIQNPRLKNLLLRVDNAGNVIGLQNNALSELRGLLDPSTAQTALENLLPETNTLSLRL